MYPLKFVPVYLEKIWGGSNLALKYQRELPSEFIGESWEIAAHPKKRTVVANGPLAGKDLSELTTEFGSRLLGRLAPAAAYQKFPLLIKLLDASENNSIQVHPDNGQALIHENELGKYEVWYIIDCKPQANMIYGLKAGTTKDELLGAFNNGNVKNVCNYIPVKPGEIYIIPPGLVHSLGAGIVLLEIQQNSDCTYRLYDYDRLDQNGQLRRIDKDKALEVVNFNNFIPSYPLFPEAGERIVDSEFFKIDSHLNQTDGVLFLMTGIVFIF